jgi:archaemetzincin
MGAIELVALRGVDCGGDQVSPAIDLDVLDRLAAELARVFHQSCRVRTEPLDISFALDPSRRQYHSTAILVRLQALGANRSRLLGVAAADLYVPVLTFVFGEAQMPGRCAVISAHRLHEEFYGLPPNGRLLRERLTKAALHELGHTFGLPHCSNWNCVMASTHAVERLDLKSAAFCRDCLYNLSRSNGPLVQW